MNSSRIASPVGDSASAACRCRSRSSNDSSRKSPRWPPESAGFSTAGKPTVSAAGAASRRTRTAANRGCGTPPSASRRRIATLCVIRCAVSVPIPGSPSASATAATTGTARSAETVSTPSTPCRARNLDHAPRRRRSRRPRASSASASPAASALRSTATTRSPSCLARRIARRWWRPAPTKRTVFTPRAMLQPHRNGSPSGSDSTRTMALSGKRILITGGAGFIGTTLARRLVDDNEIVAVDNLHRDALGGTDLADHPNFDLPQGDVLDAERPDRADARRDPHRPRRRDRRRRHRAREPGADDAREPDRHLQRRSRPRSRRRTHSSACRVLDERGLRHATPSASTRRARPRWLRRRGALDVRRLEARRRAHGARLPRGARPADRDSVRPFNVYGPGQIGGGAIRAFIEAALAGRDLTIHGDGSQIRAWCYVDDMVEAPAARARARRTRSARASTSATRARR